MSDDNDDVSLDLDALRAARSEAIKDPRTVRFGGKVWGLPDELSLDAVLAMAGGNTLTALQEILGEQWVDFKAVGLTANDFRAFAAGIDKIYGAAEGEASASPGSSSNTGSQSRRTSNGSTASTSRRVSGVANKTGSR
jgi:hypothetical protein